MSYNKTTETNTDAPHCAEIWMCWLPENNGSVQSGYRPVFISSNDMNNKYAPTLNIIPITSKAKKRLPIHVELDHFQDYGLSSFSTMLVEQIMTVSASALDRRIGKITDGDTLRRISEAMAIQLPCFAVNR